MSCKISFVVHFPIIWKSFNFQNCHRNTGGKHCETCAEGYYGHPDNACSPCPCPETNKNFARGCYVSKTSVACYCKEGYTGDLCDRCAKGFFGYPHHAEGSCESCDCNSEGIVSDECDELSGQCNCKPGVTGRQCNKCELPRHLLIDYQCQRRSQPPAVKIILIKSFFQSVTTARKPFLTPSTK